MRKTALSTNQTVQITTTTELQPHMFLDAEVFRGNGNVLVTHIGEKEYVINLGSRLSLFALHSTFTNTINTITHPHATA